MYCIHMAGELVLQVKTLIKNNNKLLNSIYLSVIIVFSIYSVETPAKEDKLQSILYVSNSGTNSILKYSTDNGAFLGTFVSSGSGGLKWPEGLTFGPDGNLYVSSFSSDNILRYNGKTGAFIDAFVTVGSGGLNGPHGLVFGSDNYLYVSSYFTRNILRYHGITGDFTRVFAPTGGDVLKRKPTGITFGPDKNLYVVSGVDVLRFNRINGAFIDLFVAQQLKAGEGIVFGPDSNLYVSDRSASQIKRFNGISGKFVDVFVSNKYQRLRGPSGLLFGQDGQLYVSSNFNHSILRYNADTGIFNDVFTSDNGGGIASPTYLSFSNNRVTCVKSPTGLIRWWSFDEGSGKTVLDIVGGNNGTLINGTTWVNGKVNLALRFDGKNDSVNLPDIKSSNQKIANAFTLETWINLAQGDVAIFDNLASNWASFRWIFGNSGLKNDTRIGLWNGGSQTQPDLSITKSKLSLNKWHHIAAVYRDNGKIYFYIDGTLDLTTTWRPVKSAQGTIPAGGKKLLWARPFSGYIDELSIYDRALSTTEIQDIFFAGGAGKCKS